MTFGQMVRVSITIPLLLAAAACVPQESAPKANAALPPASAQQIAAPATSLPPTAPAPSALPATVASPASVAPPKPGAPRPAATRIVTDLTAPRSGVGTATYRCGGGGTVSIQNLGGSLHVVGADGWTEDFAASPANQNSRYQAVTHDAIVIDGREALVMKKGSTPRTCTR